MREFSVVVVISTLMSLVVSFTLTPLLASRFAKLEEGASRSFVGRLGRGFERWFHGLTEQYARLLDRSLKKPARVLWGATLLFVASRALPATGIVGSEFIKETDRGEFIVRLELEPGATLERTNRISQQIERTIAEIPEVRKVQAAVGVGQQGVAMSNTGRIYVLLAAQNQRRRSTNEITNEIKEKTRLIPGLKIRIHQIAITGEEYGAGVQVMVRGSQPDSLRAMTALVQDAMRRTPTITDVSLSVEQGKPELRIDVDREKMARFGLTVSDVGTTLRVALTGDDESKFTEGQTEHPIRVVLDKFDRSNPDDVGKLAFLTPLGRQVELQQFADIYPASGPSKLERFNRNAAVTMTGYVTGAATLGEVAGKFTDILGPGRIGGTSVTFSGDEKNRSESSGQMGFALLASIIFVYFIMVALYDSCVYPFVVLFSSPLALVGAMITLALTRNALSIFSSLGIIMMVGLVAKNAILLVDRTNDNRDRGVAVRDALMEAGQSRLRPIFMTTLAMVFGMLPIALASGAGSEWKNGLAWALIGGLTSSMFLTLIVVPIVYTKIDRLRVRVPALFRRPFALKRLGRIRSAAEGRSASKESEVTS